MINIHAGGFGGGSVDDVVSMDFLHKASQYAERHDMHQHFNYLLEEDEASFFLYPKLLLLFKEVVRKQQVNLFLSYLTESNRQLVMTIYGPDRVYSSKRVCEKLEMTNEQRKQQIAKVRYELTKFLAKNN
ncbi:hypothetical protein BMT55_01975 [Listeria newyorkensis]|uniref:Uncharacterized protein n=1 Tax=Listeria newyorkensis TaxID=1497681 RepID=A0ABX4XQH9_9LIST|nr:MULTISPECIES: hypothetical protein [Listeria]KGL46388.1 hypothetical protein EP56_02005 [Listeriaceae bacterium FSL A5-0209]KGL41812.1 hypothetical protein EP58_09705 [Listeria newyorkensis]KMT58302.1 hypothetical protein X559_3059 [Listeria newyorkensis]PNP94279.1 hypothetical protein BMT55_01975 [Listeria newyorkensis]RQW67763.1 hypothetical protein DUK53_05455 [Listeria sp. SHR_NRA_18]